MSEDIEDWLLGLALGLTIGGILTLSIFADLVGII